MLPMIYTPFYPQLNLQQLYMFQQQYMYPKETAEIGCQCPEMVIPKETCPDQSQEEHIEKELTHLLRYLSRNISLLKDQTFDDFSRDNLKNLSQLHREINLPNAIKKRYIQVNKTKEEMTKFIIRRCFLFVKTKLNYQEKEGLPAEERDKLFYQTFFQQDEQFIQYLKESNQTIDDLIPFRRDSKMKTMNDVYLKSLFHSKLFTQYYQMFLDDFKEISIHENADKIENMTKQMIKIIYTRDFGKIKTYRRFPWKDHELMKCEDRAKELFKKYHECAKKFTNKIISKKESMIEQLVLSEKTSESVYQQVQ